MFVRKFCIAGIALSLKLDEWVAGDSEFGQFKTIKAPDYTAVFRKVPKLPEFETEPVASGTGFHVFRTDESFTYQFVGIDHMPYAVSRRNLAERTVAVSYLERGRDNITHDGGAFFHIGWEAILLRERRLILHACCVEASSGGILFSGVSGIGKSTQGDLWRRYEGARLINGDRPILYKQEDGWYAYGSPYAGSSKCHVNEHTKVRAIVMLAQAENCSIRKLSGAEAFRSVFAQTTVESWDPESVEAVCDLSEQLITDIPVYKLSCTPDKNAVDLLKETLLEEVGG